MASLWTNEPVALLDNRQQGGIKIECAPSIEALAERVLWLCSLDDIKTITEKVISEKEQQEAEDNEQAASFEDLDA